jgi:hypothetical protein
MTTSWPTNTSISSSGSRSPLCQGVIAKGTSLEVDLPDRPEAVTADVDESEWLFDSSREYMEQIKHYHRHKTGEKESDP